MNNPNLIQPIVTKLYKIIPYLPKFITTYNLTLLSILWSSGILYFGFKSLKNINYLYFIILFIFLHIITDTLDGAVGRYRNTGAIKWGYFMDHLLDFIIGNCILFVLYLNLKNFRNFVFIVNIIINLSFIISFLSLSNNGLNVSYCYNKYCIGPADSLIFIAIFIYYIIITNRNINKYFVYTIIIIITLLNLIKIYNTQKNLHKIDMKIKYSKNN